MWYGKQASPASSTSTVDQQEILFDEVQLQQQQQQQQQQQRHHQQQIHQQQIQHHNTTLPVAVSQIPISAPATTTGKRQTGSGPRATKRAKQQANSQYTMVNGTSGGTGNSRAQSNANHPSQGNSKCSPLKRPKLHNLPQQLAPWKSLQHHFLRHTDVKYRPEKRMTMAELGNEVSRRRNGWKVHHLVGQLTDLIQNESQTRNRINSLLDIFTDEGAKRIHDLASNCHRLPEQYATLLQSQRSYGKNEFKPELIVTKLDDLLKGDIQRSNMFDDQLRYCRDLIVRITNEHRDRVSRITTKFNKRIQL